MPVPIVLSVHKKFGSAVTCSFPEVAHVWSSAAPADVKAVQTAGDYGLPR